MYELDQETVLVPIDEIVIGRNITNIRTHFPEESIKELAQSIYDDGLLQPIIVMECEDPDTGDEITELVAGARRIRAIQFILANIDEEWTCEEDGPPGMVKASQFTGDIEDAEVLNAVENLEREQVDEVDTSAWLHRMVEESGWIQNDLAKKLHKSPQWVSARITLHTRGSDKLKAALREGLLAFTTAYELAKRLNHEEQDAKVDKARQNNEKLTLEEAERVDDPNKSPRPTKKKIGDMLAKAQAAAADPAKHGNAHGVYMALRWVLGTLADDEIEEVISWDTSKKAVEPVKVSEPEDEEEVPEDADDTQDEDGEEDEEE
jgi:ParB-like chromosome segregation protein Spo0J